MDIPREIIIIYADTRRSTSFIEYNLLAAKKRKLKIVVITDYIDAYDSSRLILESLMGLGEDVELVSLFFNEERLETPLSLYKIHATGLNKIFKRSHSLFKWPLLTSQFAKRITVPDADIYIVLSPRDYHS